MKSLINKSLLILLFATLGVAQAKDLTARELGADSVWMSISTVLILLMAIPGLMMLYAGMGRSKNALFTSLQILAVVAAATITWFVVGYSIAFSSFNPFFGGLGRLFGSGVFGQQSAPLDTAVFEGNYFLFQLAFAVLTSAIIVGATAERMRLSTTIAFAVSWLVLVYAPIAHWIWHPQGWLNALGHIDWAGGTVIHISAGITGLIAAKMIGPRLGYPAEPMPPHNLMMTSIGACFIWLGWFGFNTGNAFDLGSGRAMQISFITFCSASVGALSWLAFDYLLHKKMSLLGLVTGAIVGLVAITPAAGYVGLNAAFVLPLVAVLCSMISLSVIKNTLRIDDAFDVFAIHGVAGLVGTLLTPIFAFSTYSEVLRRLFANTLGATAILIYAALMTAVILWILKPITGWRVEPVEEKVGLDLTQLSETIVSER